MSDDWCETMDMPKLGCAHCRPAGERKRLDVLEVELNRHGGNTAPPRTVKVKSYAWTVTVARFPAKCGLDCGEPVETGEEIIKTAGYGWVHLRCVQAQ